MVRWAPAGITRYKSSPRMGVLVEHKAGLSVRSLEFGRRFVNGSVAGSGRQGTTRSLVKLLCLIRAMLCCQEISVAVAERCLFRGTCWIPSVGDKRLRAAQDPTPCRCQLLAGGRVGAPGPSASGHPGPNPKTMCAGLDVGCDEEGAVA